MGKNFIITLTVVIILLVQSALAETSFKQQDFAYSTTLSAGKQSLQQFELPYQILAKLERQDYGDMRIFNSQNQPVPFSIRQLEPQNYQNTDVYRLPFFRLTPHAEQNRDLQIEFSENSTRFSFNAAANNQQPHYLLLENQHQTDDLQTIKLDWQQPDEAFSIKVKLESSEDLQTWQTVNDNTTLYDLKYADTSLLQNTIILSSGNHAKYLRLSFQPASTFSLQIEKISGDYHHTTSVERENWQSFTLKQGEHPNEWLFNTGSLIPVTKIAFEIPAVGLFYQGSLYSQSSDADQNSAQITRQHPNFKREVKRALHHYPEYSESQPNAWHYQAAVTQYRLLTAAGEIASEPISLATSKDTLWKLVLEQPATLLAEQIPTVKVAWHPVMVTFLAQGKPPYQLFFGNAAIAPFNALLPPSFDNGNVETVEVQAIQEVAKVVAKEDAENLATKLVQLHWQKILLWLLLCAGVLVMGGMAYQLYERMNQKKD